MDLALTLLDKMVGTKDKLNQKKMVVERCKLSYVNSTKQGQLKNMPHIISTSSGPYYLPLKWMYLQIHPFEWHVYG